MLNTSWYVLFVKSLIFILYYITLVMDRIEQIITETISSYIGSNMLCERKKKDEKKGKDKKHSKKKAKEKRFRKKAIKGKGGTRKDLDVEYEKTYNQNVDDQEQSSVKDVLSNGFINIKKVAEKLYPDHTPEGAQSQLNKKLTGAKSDSGSTYKLKKNEVKRLRHIIATFLNQ